MKKRLLKIITLALFIATTALAFKGCGIPTIANSGEDKRPVRIIKM